MRQLINVLQLEAVGESVVRDTTIIQVPASRTEKLSADWDLLTVAQGSSVEQHRKTCLAAVVIVLFFYLDASKLCSPPAQTNLLVR